MVKDREFGCLLKELRIQKSVTQEQLGQGLCDITKLSKIESGKVEAEHYLRERLLERLGLAEENYEKILYYDDYKVWRERQNIVQCMIQSRKLDAEQNKLEEVKLLLNTYVKKHSMEDKLEKQFYLSMSAQIRRIEGAGETELKALFYQALCLTVPETAFRKFESIPLAVKELNLLLEYAHYCEDFSNEWYEELIAYLETRKMDRLTLAKIYPKAVYFFYLKCHKNRVRNHKNTDKLLFFCNKAIEILQRGNRMFYLWELLSVKEQLVQILLEESEEKELKEWLQTCINWCTALKDLHEEYGISLKTQDFCYLYVDREAYCLGDVIRIRRKMFGMTMQQLSDGICSERTISRLERNLTEPHKETVQLLFKRLNLPSSFYRKEFITENPELRQKFNDMKGKSHQKDYAASEKLLEQIKPAMLLEFTENRQAVRRYELINEWNRKQAEKEEINCKYFVEQLKEILTETLPYELVVTSGEKYLTQNEALCLQNIVVDADETCPEKEQCVMTLYMLYEKQRRSEECFDMYELVMGTIASYLGNKGNYDLSDEIGMKIIEGVLMYRRLGWLHIEKYDLLWNEVQREKYQYPLKRSADIKKVLLDCIYLCELCGELSHRSFYERKLKDGM